MTNDNVLLSSGNRWTGIASQLKRAMREVPALREGRLLIVESEQATPASCFADEILTAPEGSDDEYVAALLDICERKHVRVIIPTIDRDLLRLAPHTARFSAIGAALVCPPPALVDLCVDKLKFLEFAHSANLPHPTTYSLADLQDQHFPVFAKHRRGFGSRGAFVCQSLDEARAAVDRDPGLIFQELFETPEISVDGFISKSGQTTVRVQRTRDQVVGGEVWQSHTVRWAHVGELAARVMDSLAAAGLSGPLNVQIFSGARPVVIEVNTRLGSGSVLSNVASRGRLFYSVLVEACGGLSQGNPDDYAENVRLLRFRVARDSNPSHPPA